MSAKMGNALIELIAVIEPILLVFGFIYVMTRPRKKYSLSERIKLALIVLAATVGLILICLLLSQ